MRSSLNTMGGTFRELLVYWRFFTVLILTSTFAVAEDFDWAYREFMDVFRNQQYDQMHQYFTEHSKVGFGPNEEGFNGFLAKYSSDETCQNEIVSTLALGCRLNDNKAVCVSPPFENQDVIGIASRASFEFRDGQLKVLYLICSGD